MAASNRTVELMAEEMVKWADSYNVPVWGLISLMHALARVPGNKSFTDTIEKLTAEVERYK